jgi:hypothetical protein
MYPKPRLLAASASRNNAAVTMQAGCAWLRADNVPNTPLPPAGFTNFSAMMKFFYYFTGSSSAGTGALYWVASLGYVLTSPIFGCLCVSGAPLCAWLYLPVASSFMARHTLAQYVPTTLLGANIGPFLSSAQISQFQLQYVAISLNTAIQPRSTYNGTIFMAGYQGLAPVAEFSS